MKKYFKAPSIFGYQEIIIRIENNTIISFSENPENSDYQQYLEWLAEGNEPLPWPPSE